MRLLQTVVASMGTALENARLFDETQRLLKETEQRNAELAVINSIQLGIAGKLDFQGIVELVGERLREVLHSENLSIRWFDPVTGLLRIPYAVELGQRLDLPPGSAGEGSSWSRVLATRQPLVLAGSEIRAMPGTATAQAEVYVPIIGGDQVLGLVVMEDHNRTDAFGAPEIRLLSTVATAMGVALQSARLFDETQRLLKETERRSSELAIINSIQHGMAQELNFLAIIDLVGEKLRELFHSGDIGINLLDERSDTVLHPYVYEHGQRLTLPPVPYNPNGKVEQTLLRGENLLLSTRAEIDAFGIRTAPGTDACLCVLWVPIFFGGEFRASIQIESFERENAFDEGAVHLLSAVAASMGVALQNARLFDEIQRRGRESTALADVGRDLSSSLDLSAVLKGIARHAKDLLAAGSSAIFLPNAGGQSFHARVALGDYADKIEATIIEPGRGIIGSVLQSGQPELINRTAADPRAVQVSGTDRGDDERLMVVPLISSGQIQGAMAVWRMGESPFETHELEFLVGLSLQAAVALNNARLFDETRETLEQQRASAEVLSVISNSVADTAPVFEKILDSCERLFQTPHLGIVVADDDGMARAAAVRGAVVKSMTRTLPLPIEQSATGRVIRAKCIERIDDAAAHAEASSWSRDTVAAVGNFSAAWVPMIWEDRGIGSILVARQPPRPLSERDESLLRTFASQAVIAIRNARLFNETKEALERQTATAEVLQRDQ